MSLAPRSRNKDGKPMLYLSAPYTHPDIDQERDRYRLATMALATLFMRGHVVFSPLTMTHPIQRILHKANIKPTHRQWIDFDISFMECCDEIYILTLSGWEKSKGIAAERAWFREHNRPETFMDPQEIDLSLSWPFDELG